MKNEEFATATKKGKTMLKSVVRMLLCTTFFTLQSSLFTSCSEETEEENEYSNWKERNEAFFATLEDSLQQQGQGASAWLKLKCYSLDESTEGNIGDYVYAKIISQGDGTESPMFTDSLRVSYQGRFIPTANYPEGRVFDGTVYGQYDDKTNATSKFVMVSSGYEALVTGWITALLHMHRGDHWRVYIPQELGYKDTDNTQGSITIPAYSTLIFDITLIDFSPAGQVMPAWSARRR